MSPAPYVETGFVGDIRPTPVVAHRRVGGRRGDVDPREHVAARGDRLAALGRGFGQRFEMRSFGCHRMHPRLGHARRRFVQIRRVEANDARQRLPMGEARSGRHQRIGVARRHLDMIAEHAIVADLERRDARAVAIARFERRDRLAPVARGLAQRIECGVIAFGDICLLYTSRCV